jgi:hypothetical protein
MFCYLHLSLNEVYFLYIQYFTACTFYTPDNQTRTYYGLEFAKIYIS